MKGFGAQKKNNKVLYALSSLRSVNTVSLRRGGPGALLVGGHDAGWRKGRILY